MANQVFTFGEVKDFLNTLLDDDTESFYTDAERETAVNAAYFEVYNWAADLGDGQGGEINSTNLTITANTGTSTLPANFYRLTEVYYKASETESYSWIPIMPNQQHEYRSRISQGSKRLAFYLRGTKMILVPTPTWGSTTEVFIEYVPWPTARTNDAQTFPGIPLSHVEIIAYLALMRLKEKEGVAPSAGAIDTYNRLKAQFDRDMENRQRQRSRTLAGRTRYDLYESGF
jgi:hypothetical protein